MNTVHTIVNKKTGESFYINNAGHGDITYHVDMDIFYSGALLVVSGNTGDKVNSDEQYYLFTLKELGLPMSFWDSFFKNKGNLVIEQGRWVSTMSGSSDIPMGSNEAALMYTVRVYSLAAKPFYLNLLNSELREQFDNSDIEFLNSTLALIDEFIDVTSSIQNYEEEVGSIVTYYADREEDLSTLSSAVSSPSSYISDIITKYPGSERIAMFLEGQTSNLVAEYLLWAEYKVVTFDSSLLPALSLAYYDVSKLNYAYNIGAWNKEAYPTVDDYLISFGIKPVSNAKYYYIVELDDSNCNGGIIGDIWSSSEEVDSSDKIVQLVITNDERLIIDDRLVFFGEDGKIFN